jgi:outer membrane cobalamin receptor
MKARRLALVVAAVQVLTNTAVLCGQESQDTTRLAELVVTPTRLPTPADAVVSSVTVITGDDIRSRGIRFVQDALREVPGVAVVQGGSFGAVAWSTGFR